MDAGRLRKPERTQSSSAEVQLDKGSLGRQRLPAKAVRQWCRRSSADFGGFRFTEDDFSSNHWTRETCLEKPRSRGLRTLASDEPKLLRVSKIGPSPRSDNQGPARCSRSLSISGSISDAFLNVAQAASLFLLSIRLAAWTTYCSRDTKVVDTILGPGIFAGLKGFRDRRTNRIGVNVGDTSQQDGFIE